MTVVVGHDSAKTRKILVAGGLSAAYYSIPAAEACANGRRVCSGWCSMWYRVGSAIRLLVSHCSGPCFSPFACPYTCRISGRSGSLALPTVAMHGRL